LLLEIFAAQPRLFINSINTILLLFRVKNLSKVCASMEDRLKNCEQERPMSTDE